MIFKHILLLIYFQISRYGKGKAANYIVPKVVFGDIDAATLQYLPSWLPIAMLGSLERL